MSSSYAYNKRRYERQPIKPLDQLENLTMIENQNDVSILPVDVSKVGLGVVSFDPLKPGQTLRLNRLQNAPELVVVWCQANSSEQQTFSCGLKLIDDSVDLRALVERYGWI